MDKIAAKMVNDDYGLHGEATGLPCAGKPLGLPRP